jgi:sulfate adenylyltransferase
MTQNGIAPHGGVLINRELTGGERLEALKKAEGLQKLVLTKREISDLEMIATGGMSPLTGFMNRADFESVVEKRALSGGLPWTLPIAKDLTDLEKTSLKLGQEIGFLDPDNHILAILKVEEIFPHDKGKHAREVYGTEDPVHPGVAQVLQMGDYLVGGRIWLLNRPVNTQFLRYRLDPAQTRELFRQKGWKRIAAFQTRNPIHRAHEYIQKCALEIVEGLLLHPLVGETKGDDVSADIRVRSYEAVLEKYYPKDRAVMAVFPAAMRYAGPREAIFHALVRKNYGCTHFIVGRDHAGVSRPDGKPFYGSFDAQRIFEEFDAREIAITPLFFDNTFYCKVCQGMASPKTCPHDPSHHATLSGTKLRELLRKGEMPPPELTRPEVAQVLIEGFRQNASYQI